MSVRSGAKFSMPGMMDTVLNLGLNEETLHGLVALTGNERFGWDAYRRFIQMFGRIVMDVKGERFDHALEAAKHARGAEQDTDLTADDLRALVDEFKAIVREDTGRDFPSDPYEQLDLAIKAVFASWFGKRAVDYRNNQKIAHDLGTAVNVVTMVFGNMGDDSGTGVAFTRDPNTGEKTLFGEYLTNAQGEDVVAGIRTAPEDRPDADRHARGLRRVPADRPAARAPLPRRPGPRVHDRARQAVHAPDAERQADRRRRGEDRHRPGRRRPDHEGGGARPDRAGPRRPAPARPRSIPARRRQVRPRSPRASTPRRAPPSGARCSTPTPPSSGSIGGEKVILVRIETSPDDFHGMAVAQGILTARGGATSPRRGRRPPDRQAMRRGLGTT